LIEREIFPLVSVTIEAQVLKEHGTQTFRARPLEIARRQDLVGVEIGQQEWAGLGAQLDEFFHCASLCLAAGKQRANIRKVSADRGGGDHCRWHQMRAPTRPLPAPKV